MNLDLYFKNIGSKLKTITKIILSKKYLKI